MKFREGNMMEGRFEVAPQQCVRAQQMAWDAMFKKMDVRLDLIIDPAMNLLACGVACA